MKPQMVISLQKIFCSYWIRRCGEGIFELRAKVGSDITRVLYFFYVERHIILTNGFIKKTQKTPRKKSNGQRNIAQTICAGRRAANECEI